MFLDYLASPHQTAKYVTPLNTMFDFENRRAITIEGHDPVITFTAVRDLAVFVAKAVEYEGAWPVDGGIRGNRTTYSSIVKLGQKIRGKFESLVVLRREALLMCNIRCSFLCREGEGRGSEGRASQDLLGSAGEPSIHPGGSGCGDAQVRADRHSIGQRPGLLGCVGRVQQVPARFQVHRHGGVSHGYLEIREILIATVDDTISNLIRVSRFVPFGLPCLGHDSFILRLAMSFIVAVSG